METISPHERAAEQREVLAHTQVLLKVVVERQGLAVIQLDARMYERYSLICTNGMGYS